MKVVVVGLGSIAHKHIAVLREMQPGAVVYALRHNQDAETIEGVLNLYTVDQIKTIAPDFILISNPTGKHYQTIREMACLSIPLFIEKPLFDHLYPKPKIDSYTYVACNLRFLAALQFVKKNLGNKRINEVNVYCGSYLPEWRKGVDWRSTYSANRNLGGGVHLDLIHEIDYIYWLLGSPQKVHKTFRNQSSLEIDVWDYAHYVMEYPGFAVSVVLNYYRRDYKRTLELVFETETWEVDLAKNTVMSKGKVLFESPQTIAQTYYDQMSCFVEYMKTGTSFNALPEAYEVLQICLGDEN